MNIAQSEDCWYMEKKNDQDIMIFILLITGYILLIKLLNLKGLSLLLFQRTSGLHQPRILIPRPLSGDGSDDIIEAAFITEYLHQVFFFQAIRLCGNLISTYQTDLRN